MKLLQRLKDILNPKKKVSSGIVSMGEIKQAINKLDVFFSGVKIRNSRITKIEKILLLIE